MKAVIIEDEHVATQNLQRLISLSADDIQVIAILQSVEESVEWFSLNPAPDVLFLDIHLADGSSFTIFEKIKITCPIIFTTAYDEYALKAFDQNSIDYLLKPISQKNLERALLKLRNILPSKSDSNAVLSDVLAAINQTKKTFKSNFLIPHKDKLVPLATNKIACMYTENKMVKIITEENTTYNIDSTLEELFSQLDPTLFFRANRQYIVSHKAIKDISIWFGSKVSINMVVNVPDKIIVSKARVSEFKAWYTN